MSIDDVRRWLEHAVSGADAVTWTAIGLALLAVLWLVDSRRLKRRIERLSSEFAEVQLLERRLRSVEVMINRGMVSQMRDRALAPAEPNP